MNPDDPCYDEYQAMLAAETKLLECINTKDEVKETIRAIRESLERIDKLLNGDTNGRSSSS